MNGRLARACTWALCIGALAVLGDWGLQHLPLWAGGMLPVALWLLLWNLMGTHPAGCSGWAGGPLAAARWSMLPMMAMLPHMAAWCGASGPPSAVWWALHLAAMLVPAWWPRAAAAERATRICTGLLLAGAVALWAWPGLQGLMAASLLHTLAWGVSCTVPARTAARGLQRAAAPVALLLLGVAVASVGPPALMLVHGLLALCALPAVWRGFARARAVAVVA